MMIPNTFRVESQAQAIIAPTIKLSKLGPTKPPTKIGKRSTKFKPPGIEKGRDLCLHPAPTVL